jgi:signal transduction histidine kinase
LHYGLEKALELEVSRLNEANDKTFFNLYIHREVPVQDSFLELTVYRCFQELSSNILKHAGASEANVQLHLLQEEVQLLVEDNGIGFPSGIPPEGLGLSNMKSRIALFDGTLVVDSLPSKGATIIITVQRPTQNLT